MVAKPKWKCIKNATFWYMSRLPRFPFCRILIQVAVRCISLDVIGIMILLRLGGFMQSSKLLFRSCPVSGAWVLKVVNSPILLQKLFSAKSLKKQQLLQVRAYFYRLIKLGHSNLISIEPGEPGFQCNRQAPKRRSENWRITSSK